MIKKFAILSIGTIVFFSILSLFTYLGFLMAELHLGFYALIITIIFFAIFCVIISEIDEEKLMNETMLTVTCSFALAFVINLCVTEYIFCK